MPEEPEVRMAHLQGAYEQIDKRLASAEARLSSLEQEIRSLRSDLLACISGLRTEPSRVLPNARVIQAKAEVQSSRSAADFERELILKTLKETGNNKAETARRLGLDVKTIRNKLKSYELY